MLTRLTAAALALAPLSAPALAATAGDPIVWAHRGASYFSRENTVEAFRLAGDLGADGFELDVLLTSDGQLAVFHDNTLEDLTDVETRFGPSRARADGSYYVADFTTADLRTLEVDGTREGTDVIRDAARNPYAVAADYAFRIPTYAEALDVLNDYPGLKVLTEVKDNFSEFTDKDAATARARVADALLAEWTARGYDGADDPVVVQSFSTAFMAEIDARLAAGGSTLRTVQLEGNFFLLPTAGFATEAELTAYYAAQFGALDGFAPNLNLLPVDGAPFYTTINPQGLDVVSAAQAAGLEVYVWTLILPPGLDEDDYFAWAFDPTTPIDFMNQYAQVIGLGVDGIITDNPDIARAVLAQTSVIPLPAAGWMLLTGVAALAAARRRR